MDPERSVLVAVAAALVILTVGCPAPTPVEDVAATAESAAPRPAWAIAIHGGAGRIDRDLEDGARERFLTSLRSALELGRERLDAGDRAIDVVEAVVRLMEDDPAFNAGRGAVYTWEGAHALDASIMDGATAATGAVAGVTTVRHPITLARRVMECSPHVLLAGEGAERFADHEAVERVDPEWFGTERRRAQWRAYRDRMEAEVPVAVEDVAEEHGTVGVVALDREGRLAAGTSTGGTTGKRWGRVGDSPIVGAGTWASDRSCAVSGTGKGEEFLRHAVARTIAARAEFLGETCGEAAVAIVHDLLDAGDGGVIVLDPAGRITFAYNTDGMMRGAADADGRFEVAIWE